MKEELTHSQNWLNLWTNSSSNKKLSSFLKMFSPGWECQSHRIPPFKKEALFIQSSSNTSTLNSVQKRSFQPKDQIYFKMNSLILPILKSKSWFFRAGFKEPTLAFPHINLISAENGASQEKFSPYQNWLLMRKRKFLIVLQKLMIQIWKLMKLMSLKLSLPIKKISNSYIKSSDPMIKVFLWVSKICW